MFYLGCQQKLLYFYFLANLYTFLHPSAFFFPQWDLVCDRKSLSKMTATIFFLGVMLGAIAFGYLSDKYAVSIVMEQLT